MSIISRLLDIENEMDNFGDDFAFGSPMFGHTSSGPRLRRNLLPMLFTHGRRRHSPYSPSDKALKRIKFETPRASTVGKDGFEICINVEQFEPHEVTVKTIDNMVVVEGKHEEREDDHGYITRHFIRRYPLPKDYDTEKVVSTLSSDGFLTVKAPPPTKENEVERVIQIQHTGRLHSEPLKDKHDDDPKAIEDCNKNGGDQDKMEN